MYIILYAVPKIPVRISNIGPPNALQQFTLNCTVSPPSSLALNVQSYDWFRNGTKLSMGNQLHFQQLQLFEENNIYKCQFQASSKYLNGIVSNKSNEHRIKITSEYYELNSSLKRKIIIFIKPLKIRTKISVALLKVIEN